MQPEEALISINEALRLQVISNHVQYGIFPFFYPQPLMRAASIADIQWCHVDGVSIKIINKLNALLFVCQPDNADALKEIIDIKAQVQRRLGQPVPQRAPTAEPGGQEV